MRGTSWRGVKISYKSTLYFQDINEWRACSLTNGMLLLFGDNQTSKLHLEYGAFYQYKGEEKYALSVASYSVVEDKVRIFGRGSRDRKEGVYEWKDGWEIERIVK